MSDDLDQDLLRRFASANEPLAGAEFHTRVMAELHRRRGWRDVPGFVGASLGAMWSGVSAGITAPLRLRMGATGLFAIVIGAIVSTLAFLSV